MLSDSDLDRICAETWSSGALTVLRAVATAAAKNALEEAADAWHEENTGTSPRAYGWLRARAQSIPTTTKENER